MSYLLHILSHSDIYCYENILALISPHDIYYFYWIHIFLRCSIAFLIYENTNIENNTAGIYIATYTPPLQYVSSQFLLNRNDI